jgi:hypothetical protein
MAATADDIVTRIEQTASQGEQAEASLGRAIVEGIEANPAAVASRLTPRLKEKGLTETQLAVYVWALGLAKDKAAAKEIQELYRRSSSDLVKGNCLQALTEIGGKESEEFLLSVLQTTTDEGMRFNILNLLAQLQSEAVLPATDEVLRKNPDQYYWQSIFVFGKLGDKAVPFLLQRIKHPDRNIRVNTINVLGQWLIAPEAAQPFLEQYRAEQNEELRGMLLGSLERTMGDLGQLKAVFEQIVAWEKSPRLATFARETLENLPGYAAELETFKKMKKVAPEAFERAYAALYTSAGRDGSYDGLAFYSTVKDEGRLKSLRERILQRNSDEAFQDYQTVNDIIMRNRLATR